MTWVASDPSIAAANPVIRSPVIPTSIRSWRLWEGSITVPPFKSRSYIFVTSASSCRYCSTIVTTDRNKDGGDGGDGGFGVAVGVAVGTGLGVADGTGASVDVWAGVAGGGAWWSEAQPSKTPKSRKVTASGATSGIPFTSTCSPRPGNDMNGHTHYRAKLTGPSV